jgi:predicted SAM-dependent methyltransferase
MIQTINYRGVDYPAFQTIGNASQFAIPFAQQVCSGVGYDVGCMKQEWAFPGARAVDLDFPDDYHALNLPEEEPDYIFSSHCLEHTDDWIEVMDYWYERLKEGGTLFLYLPDFSQMYWRPWNNRKHKHAFTSGIIRAYMIDRGYKNVFVSQTDLNNSFMAMGEK